MESRGREGFEFECEPLPDAGKVHLKVPAETSLLTARDARVLAINLLGAAQELDGIVATVDLKLKKS